MRNMGVLVPNTVMIDNVAERGERTVYIAPLGQAQPTVIGLALPLRARKVHEVEFATVASRNS